MDMETYKRICELEDIWYNFFRIKDYSMCNLTANRLERLRKTGKEL